MQMKSEMDSMVPMSANDRKKVTLSAIDTARKFLRYALVEVDFEYHWLTDEEKAIVTSKEFEVMVEQFKLR
jgi:hypothetical protein